jgi:hypothetical protein
MHQNGISRRNQPAAICFLKVTIIGDLKISTLARTRVRSGQKRGQKGPKDSREVTPLLPLNELPFVSHQSSRTIVGDISDEVEVESDIELLLDSLCDPALSFIVN